MVGFWGRIALGGAAERYKELKDENREYMQEKSDILQTALWKASAKRKSLVEAEKSKLKNASEYLRRKGVQQDDINYLIENNPVAVGELVDKVKDIEYENNITLPGDVITNAIDVSEDYETSDKSPAELIEEAIPYFKKIEGQPTEEPTQKQTFLGAILDPLKTPTMQDVMREVDTSAFGATPEEILASEGSSFYPEINTGKGSIRYSAFGPYDPETAKSSLRNASESVLENFDKLIKRLDKAMTKFSKDGEDAAASKVNEFKVKLKEKLGVQFGADGLPGLNYIDGVRVARLISELQINMQDIGLDEFDGSKILRENYSEMIDLFTAPILPFKANKEFNFLTKAPESENFITVQQFIDGEEPQPDTDETDTGGGTGTDETDTDTGGGTNPLGITYSFPTGDGEAASAEDFIKGIKTLVVEIEEDKSLYGSTIQLTQDQIDYFGLNKKAGEDIEFTSVTYGTIMKTMFDDYIDKFFKLNPGREFLVIHLGGTGEDYKEIAITKDVSDEQREKIYEKLFGARL